MLHGDLMSRQIHIMMGKGCEGFYYPSKILDELTVVATKAKECSYLFSFV